MEIMIGGADPTDQENALLRRQPMGQSAPPQ
jgi:hypothetical protein